MTPPQNIYVLENTLVADKGNNIDGYILCEMCTDGAVSAQGNGFHLTKSYDIS